jgi:predicted nuclease of restriction endonuclease-like (RecB) superfamily
VGLYWDIGKMIAQKQDQEGWGKSVVETLASDLQKEFPGERGYSAYNLWLMVRLYHEYQGDQFLESMIPEISWSHNIMIMKKCQNKPERQFYMVATKKFGWTTRVLDHQIDNKTFEKYLLNQTNFDQAQTEEFKDQKKLAIKDHYTFDFLELSENHSEHELEAALLKNIRAFLLELGGDFCFIGNQYRLMVEDEEFFIDLLLFHRKLQSLVAIELKTGSYKPEYKGKMEFYLTVLNEQLKQPKENDAIGIIICRNKKRLIVEYSLRSSNMPIGIASYSTTSEIPAYYKSLLPDPEEMAKSLEKFFILSPSTPFSGSRPPPSAHPAGSRHRGRASGPPR